jgi:hypothetical protein
MKEQIKQIISAPILRPIDYTSDNPVFLLVDTSNIAVGFILSQADELGKRHPARYGSLPMNKREARYSQPKLELHGLYRALRHWRIYLVGIKNLHVEMDAEFIGGMPNEPDLQPNAAMNRWIQGILLFDINLVHVPASHFAGPDTLSRRLPASQEEYVYDNETWMEALPHHHKFQTKNSKISASQHQQYYLIIPTTFLQSSMITLR